MAEEKISIIVPVYNVEFYIRRCLDSLIGQTYRNLEIILVDDGSTDASGEICDEYADRDDRIKVIHKQNGGLSDARNAGLEIATGEYIGFVDSDDWVELDMYERLYRLCSENKLDLVVARFCEAYEGKDKETTYTDDFFVTDGIGLLEINICGHSKYVVTNSVWDRLYKKEILEGLVFPVGRKYEDICFSTAVFLRAKRCGYLDSKMYHYTIRDDSIMGKGAKSKESFNDDIIDDLLALSRDKCEMIYQAGYMQLAEHCFFYYLLECLRYAEKVYGRKEYVAQRKWLVNEYKSNKKWIKGYCRENNVTDYGILVANLSVVLYVAIVRIMRRGCAA